MADMISTVFETNEERFQRCYLEARGYHWRANKFHDEKQRVSLIFNVAAMAIESYLIALCAFHNVMPFNHSYRCLMFDVKKIETISAELEKQITDLDKIFGICSLDNYFHGDPTADDMLNSLDVCEKIYNIFLKKQLNINDIYSVTVKE
ncbi:hypothetical protein [uncultured Tolumonas sp.]|uniref:hypothetical protein n=1 Tax=uncultured Tolumonas sp. TaxID=263765 RepID=UPI002A0A2938|nr:hypothetical protein [uncultured Tolumonas sp.]